MQHFIYDNQNYFNLFIEQAVLKHLWQSLLTDMTDNCCTTIILKIQNTSNSLLKVGCFIYKHPLGDIGSVKVKLPRECSIAPQGVFHYTHI